MTKLLIRLLISAHIIAGCSTTEDPTQNSKLQQYPLKLITPEQNKIFLIILDGVAHAEVFHGVSTYFQVNYGVKKQTLLFQNLDPNQELLFGDGIDQSYFKTNSKYPVSLPGYKSIFLGTTSDCESNNCRETDFFRKNIFDNLVESGYEQKRIAVFSSWEKTKYSIGPHRSSLSFSTGLYSNHFPQITDEMQEIIEHSQNDRPDWRISRKDIYTKELSMSYIKQFEPIFTTIVLGDADEWAHLEHYKNYIKTIKSYAVFIQKLKEFIEQSPFYKNTTSLIITSDHGRGENENWRGHSSRTKSSKYSFLYTSGSAKVLFDDLVFDEVNRNHSVIYKIVKKLLID